MPICEGGWRHVRALGDARGQSPQEEEEEQARLLKPQYARIYAWPTPPPDIFMHWGVGPLPKILGEGMAWPSGVGTLGVRGFL